MVLDLPVLAMHHLVEGAQGKRQESAVSDRSHFQEEPEDTKYTERD
jgi:hypothetical protein